MVGAQLHRDLRLKAVICHPTLGRTAAPGLPNARRCNVLSPLSAGHDGNQGGLEVRAWKLCAQLPLDGQDLVQLWVLLLIPLYPVSLEQLKGFAQLSPSSSVQLPAVLPPASPGSSQGSGAAEPRRLLQCTLVQFVQFSHFQTVQSAVSGHATRWQSLPET